MLAHAWAPYVPNTVFLVDSEGFVRYVGSGGKNGWYPDVDKEIPAAMERLLAER